MFNRMQLVNSIIRSASIPLYLPQSEMTKHL